MSEREKVTMFLSDQDKVDILQGLMVYRNEIEDGTYYKNNPKEAAQRVNDLLTRLNAVL